MSSPLLDPRNRITADGQPGPRLYATLQTRSFGEASLPLHPPGPHAQLDAFPEVPW